MQQIKCKVLAYILRRSNGEVQCLAFRHRDYPEAGWQIPAGTVQGEEDLQIALLREVYEESGLRDFTAIQCLGDQLYASPSGEHHQRTFYALRISVQVPDHYRHIVSAGTEDKGLYFDFEWWPLVSMPPLAADQGHYLDRCKEVDFF